MQRRGDRSKSKHAMFQATEDGENCVASVGVVQKRNWSCVVKSADRCAKPAHGCRLIADHFHSPANDGGLSLIFALEFRRIHPRNIPAIEALIKLAMVPANIALTPNLAKSFLRSGTNAPMPPICIPMEPKLAKPHKAK